MRVFLVRDPTGKMKREEFWFLYNGIIPPFYQVNKGVLGKYMKSFIQSGNLEDAHSKAAKQLAMTRDTTFCSFFERF